MNLTTRTEYNAQNPTNQMYYRNIQGSVINEDDEFSAYISSFEYDKLPMEDHPLFKNSSSNFGVQLQSSGCVTIPVVRKYGLQS